MPKATEICLGLTHFAQGQGQVTQLASLSHRLLGCKMVVCFYEVPKQNIPVPTDGVTLRQLHVYP